VRAAGISSLSVVAAALVGSASAFAAGPPQLGPVGSPTPGTQPPPLTARLSTTRAGAKRVVLTLRLQTALVCGEAGPGAIVVRLPKAAKIPATLPRAAVAVGGHAAAKLRVTGRRVTISPSVSPGMLCQSITIGTLVIRFTHLARLENPRAPGRYTVVVRRGTTRAVAKLAITA